MKWERETDCSPIFIVHVRSRTAVKSQEVLGPKSEGLVACEAPPEMQMSVSYIPVPVCKTSSAKRDCTGTHAGGLE